MMIASLDVCRIRAMQKSTQIRHWSQVKLTDRGRASSTSALGKSRMGRPRGVRTRGELPVREDDAFARFHRVSQRRSAQEATNVD
mmetsp:Transcript_36926/g.98380  ORF Transcript_36926/g.98380 Transcript_36926/m.98380 type:complete len:85 (-) Transcript_36926:209-463(-)